MILTADIGNSRIKFKLMDGRRPCAEAIISSRTDRTALEIMNEVEQTLTVGMTAHGDEALQGAIIGSVVPALTNTVESAIRFMFKEIRNSIITLRPGLHTGIDIRTDYQSELGADIIANAVGAKTLVKAPFAVVDAGTAITISLIDGNDRFQGVSIVPGLRSAARALKADCASLSFIEPCDTVFVDGEKHILGKNTADSVRRGIVLGAESMIDSMIDRIVGEYGLDSSLPVVLCGGDAYLLHLRHDCVYDVDLTAKGLTRIWELNSGAQIR